MKHVDQSLSSLVTQSSGAAPQPQLRSPAGGAAAGQAARTGAAGRDHIDVINQVFAELALAYHNQFHKAYGQDGALTLAKKYWLSVLGEFPPEVILRAVRLVVRSSEYLPTLAAIVQACENAHELFGLPTAQAAYVEACCAPLPKAEQRWSHPAVFLAAQETGWHALASEPQAQVFPLFEYNYRQLCQRVMRGEELQVPVPRALPETVSVPLTPEENLQRLAQLRRQFDL